MDVRVRLVHADANQRVVLVRAFEGDRCIASALGEAATAEEAEDRARERLTQRLPRSQPHPSASSPTPTPTPSLSPSSSPSATPDHSPRSDALEPPSAAREEPMAASEDPEDWGADLAQLDVLLRQLGWGKEEERVFLQRLFGHPSRSRLTHYGDLLLLKRALAALPAGVQPTIAPLPLRRTELLSQCDGLLQRLGWSTDQARQALDEQFAATSRQHLSDEQLLAFNLMLEGELLGPLESG